MINLENAFENKPLRFNPWLTLFLCIVLLGVFARLIKNNYECNSLDGLKYPCQTAVQVLERDIDLSESLETADKKSRSQIKPPSCELRESMIKAAQGYEELIRYLQKDAEKSLKKWIEPIQARRIVILNELGLWKRTESILKDFKKTPQERLFTNTIRKIYKSTSNHRNNFPELVKFFQPVFDRMLSLEWSGTRIFLRIAMMNNDYRVMKDIKKRNYEHHTFLNQMSLLSVLPYLGMMGAGIIVLGWWLIRDRTIKNLSNGSPVPAWEFLEGLGVIVRAAFCGVIILFSEMVCDQYEGLKVLSLWGTLFASLPMMFYIDRFLIKYDPHTVSQTFGFKILDRRWTSLVFFTLALGVIDQGGSVLLSFISDAFKTQSHWSEWVDEDLVWGGPRTVAMNIVDGVLWAPLFEEIGCRGLLYSTLRTRFKPVLAAFVSAFLFSAIHMYSMAGFLQIFWSGFVWALAYEKTRSLLPGVLCHALNNAYVSSSMILLYR